MRDPQNVCHIAIPTKDLDEAVGFYVAKLGCKLARRYDDRITIDFFGDQVVCHLDPDAIVETPTFYPRHFGVTFRKREDFDALHRLAKSRGLPFFVELSERFADKIEAHRFFGLIDPSNNILEFKHYDDPRMMY